MSRQQRFVSTITGLIAVLACLEVSAQPTLSIPDSIPEAAPTLIEPTLPPLVASPSAARTPYNLHVVASEDLLNRFIARSTAEPGEVDDFVFGAKIEGQQWTTTQLSLDLRPSGDRAHAAFILDGHVRSQTTGRTDQGAVHSVGQQQFHAVKDVFFDGLALSTRHAAVHVKTQNQNVGASTRLDGTPLEGLGTRIALKRAERNRQQTEEYAKQRVVEKVYPSFDKEVDQQLADANDRLEDQLRSALRRANLLPTSQLARSSDAHLHYAARMVVGDGDSLIAPAVPLVGPHGLTLYLHESLLNGLLSRLNLQGRKVTDRELKALGAQLRSAVRGTEAENDEEVAPSTKVETEIEFDATEPLAVRFVGNQMELELRAALRPAGQELLPPLLITVPMKLERQPTGEWKLAYGDIGIRALNGEDVPVLAKTLIRQAIQSDLPQVTIPALLKSSNWPAGKPLLKVAELQAADGWLVVSLDAASVAVIDSPPVAEPLPRSITPIRARRR